MKNLFCILLLTLVTNISFAPQCYSAESSQVSLKLMNFNVKGTPVFWYWHFRHKQIGKLLFDLKKSGKGADFIAFQEMMHRKTSRIHKIAKYKYRDRGPEGRWIRISSGLEVITDAKIIKKNKMKYRKCSGVDCFSRKGIQHVRVKFPKVPFPIDVYNTHLNAGKNKHRLTRHNQVYQMISFINKTRDPSIPMILLGDFNFRQTDFIYDFLVSSLNLQNAANYCGVYQDCRGESDPYEIWKNKLIDHQFFANDNLNKISMRPVFYFHYFKDAIVGKWKKVPLSDHPAVLVKYIFNYQ